MRLLNAFNDVIADCNLLAMQYHGPKTTWCRGRRQDNLVFERLDRGLANAAWKERFPNILEEHLLERSSDHLPLLFHCHGFRQVLRRKEKCFRFENRWNCDTECKEIIAESWMFSGCASGKDLILKIEDCGAALSSWNSRKFSKIYYKLREVKKKLESAIVSHEAGEAASEVQALQAELDEILCHEEIMWQQHSKQLWLQEGDKNTAFFHSVASKRKEQNTILKILDENGIWKKEREEIEMVALSYFENLFQSSCTEVVALEVASLVENRVTDEMRERLSAGYTKEEVKATLDSMDPGKSPGPDGMNACFYKDHWEVVGTDVTAVVLAILHGEMGVADLNETFIVLLPKVSPPSKMQELRPISLCNIVYKLVAKVLANRLRECLDSLIDSSQSAFVSGRSIYDNSMVAHEIIHTMQRHKTGSEGEITVKLDMSKAYDRVEWFFWNM